MTSTAPAPTNEENITDRALQLFAMGSAYGRPSEDAVSTANKLVDEATGTNPDTHFYKVRLRGCKIGSLSRWWDEDAPSVRRE